MFRTSHAFYTALLLTFTVPAAKATTTDIFTQWTQTQWVDRSMSLKELGITNPAVFDYTANQREFYLPVPQYIPIDRASFTLNGSYLRANGGHASMSVSIDGYPVAAKKFNDDNGNISQLIGIDGFPRQSGFVQLGVQWSSFLYEHMCSNNTAIGNNLTITPNSVFQYRFNRNYVKDISTALNTLPLSPRMLTSSVVDKNAFDTAWRVGLELTQHGKKMTFTILPSVGDVIDLSQVIIPNDLSNIPSFQALSGKNHSFQIKNLAQLGALIALGENGPIQADIVIQDKALMDTMSQSISALRQEIASVAPQAITAFDTYIFQRFSLLKNNVNSASVGLYTFSGLPTIAISSESKSRVANLFNPYWKNIPVVKELQVDKIAIPDIVDDAVLLSKLASANDMVGSINVASHADRSMTFDLGEVAKNGYIPSKIAFDVSAAPDVKGVSPIASIFFNDYLLTAEQLNGQGKPQRLTADIPPYVLSARNTIRIAFYRQPTQAFCQEPSISYPVSILPGSHLIFKKQSLNDDFIGISAQFSNPTDLIIPSDWLNHPQQSLPQVVEGSYATGLSIQDTTTLLLNSKEQPAKARHTYLAFNLDTKTNSSISRQKGQLMLAEKSNSNVLLDTHSLNELSLIEVTHEFGEKGISYNTVGKKAPQPALLYRLTQGDLAIVGNNGLLLQIDKNDPSGINLAKISNPESLFEKYIWLWIFLFAAFAFALLLARISYVRRTKINNPSEK